MRASAVVACLACLLAVPAGASGAVSAGATGWLWGNPLPQGDDLRATAFSGASGVAVGDGGVVVRTDDAGASWSAGASNTEADLTDVAMPDASTVYAGGGCVLRRSADGGRTFQRVAFTVRESKCSARLADIAFPTPSVGYLFLDDGAVLRTTNGGRSFARRTRLGLGSSVPQGGIADATFLDANTGVVATGLFAPAFLRTIDGGQSWTGFSQAGIERMLSLDFVTPLVGYAAGNGTSPMATTVDGGVTWTPLPLTGAVGFPQALSCADANNCALVAGLQADSPGDHLTWTADGGATGTTLLSGGLDMAALAFASPTRVIAVGAGGATLASDNDGHSYARVGGEVGGEFIGLRPSVGDTLFAWVGDGTLARSTDGGRTWSPLGSATLSRVIDVSFVSDQLGYLLSASGALQRTDDAGASWSFVTGQATGGRALVATGPDALLVATRRGVLRSTDAGATFEPAAGARGSVSAFDSAGTTLIAYGAKAVLASRDGGARWRALRRPRGGGLESVDFVSPARAYAVRDDGSTVATKNGGRTWKLLDGLGRDDIAAVSFGDARHGFAMLGSESGLGGVLRTSDGGRTWRPQILGKRPLIAIAALGAEGGAALTEGLGHLYSTASGGDDGTRSALTIRVGSKKRVGRRTVVTIAGHLKPAPAGAGVSVTALIGGDWVRKFAKVSAHGRFRTTWKLRRATVFVAQYRGAPGIRAAGTPALRVRLGAHKRR